MPDQPPALDYATPKPPNPGSWKGWILLGIVAIGGWGWLFVILPALREGFGHPNFPKCSSNLHQIGLAILLYQNDNAGAYPPSVDELLENEQITPAVFVCPSSNDSAASGPTTQAVIADLHKPGHLSYIYIGQGLSDKVVSDDMVVLYEPLANHGGTGMNVLFGDGHAEWFDATVGTQLIAAAATGRRVHVSAGGVVSTTPIVATMPATTVP